MEFTILVLIFWVPVLIIIIKNLLWDLSLWESKQYRFGRFFIYLFWDNDKDNRNYFITIIKFLLFCLVNTFLFSGILAIPAIFLSYLIWSAEIFSFLEKLLSNKVRVPNIFSTRNFLILSLGALFFISVISVISIPFIELNRSTTATSYDIANIVPGSTAIYPDVYIYLSISVIFGLFFDLITSIFLTVLVFITSPLGWLKKRSVIQALTREMNNFKTRPTIISVVGSAGKTTIIELLYLLLKDGHQVIKTSNVYTSTSNLAQDILNKVSESTEYILIEVDGYRLGEISDIYRIINPDITVMTGFDIQHLGLFRNIREYIHSREEVLAGDSSNRIYIANLDNKLSSQILSLTKGQKIGYSLTKNFQNTQIDVAYMESATKTKQGYKILVTDKLKHYHLNVNTHRKYVLELVMPVFVLTKELKLDTDKLMTLLEEFEINSVTPIKLKGDNNTALFMNNQLNSNYRGIISNINYINNLSKTKNYKRIILLTDGIQELGRFKKETYKKMADKLKDNINVLITTDRTLYSAFLRDNTKVGLHKCINEDEVIYTLRKEIKPGDAILLEGEFTDRITESLRSQDSSLN